jgi:hypothetical protein
MRFCDACHERGYRLGVNCECGNWGESDDDSDDDSDVEQSLLSPRSYAIPLSRLFTTPPSQIVRRPYCNACVETTLNPPCEGCQMRFCDGCMTEGWLYGITCDCAGEGGPDVATRASVTKAAQAPLLSLGEGSQYHHTPYCDMCGARTYAYPCPRCGMRFCAECQMEYCLGVDCACGDIDDPPPTPVFSLDAAYAEDIPRSRTEVRPMPVKAPCELCGHIPRFKHIRLTCPYCLKCVGIRCPGNHCWCFESRCCVFCGDSDVTETQEVALIHRTNAAWSGDTSPTRNAKGAHSVIVGMESGNSFPLARRGGSKGATSCSSAESEAVEIGVSLRQGCLQTQDLVDTIVGKRILICRQHFKQLRRLDQTHRSHIGRHVRSSRTRPSIAVPGGSKTPRWRGNS